MSKLESFYEALQGMPEWLDLVVEHEVGYVVRLYMKEWSTPSFIHNSVIKLAINMGLLILITYRDRLGKCVLVIHEP